MTAEQEKIIITQVLAGNAQTFALLVKANKDMAVVTAYNILLNQEDAEEVAQDAFVKAYSSLDTYKATARFSSWFYRIVVNTALNKKKLKKQIALEITESLADEMPAQINETLALQITAEHRKYIQTALQSLALNERLCLTLYYLNEFTTEEIQQLTGLSVSNIKVLLYRGRKNLYAALHKSLKKEMHHLIQQ